MYVHVSYSDSWRNWPSAMWKRFENYHKQFGQTVNQINLIRILRILCHFTSIYLSVVALAFTPFGLFPVLHNFWFQHLQNMYYLHFHLKSEHKTFSNVSVSLWISVIEKKPISLCIHRFDIYMAHIGVFKW